MATQARIEFRFFKNNEILKKIERIISINNYKDGLLGEEFIIFKEYESVAVFFQSCNEGDYLSIECFDSEDLKKIYNDQSVVISNGSEKDGMLVPGQYYVEIKIQDKLYKGLYKIEPSSISWQGLNNIRWYIEKRYSGLTKDLFGERKSYNPNHQFYYKGLFEIYDYIEKNENKIFNTLNSIIHNPIQNLDKNYKMEHFTRYADNKIQKWLSRKGSSMNSDLNNPEFVLQKHTNLNLDTNENLLIRNIVHKIRLILIELNKNFITIKERYERQLTALEEEHSRLNDKFSEIYNSNYISSHYLNEKRNRICVTSTNINKYKKKNQSINEIMQNIKKIISKLGYVEYQSWMKDLKGYEKINKPTLRMFKEHRYNTLFFIYKNINTLVEERHIEKKQMYRYKSTSKIFEYFTIAMIIEIFIENGLKWTKGWTAEHIDEFRSFEIPSETELLFEDEKNIVKVFYDYEIKKHIEDYDKSQFISISSTNRRPDVLIAVFDKKEKFKTSMIVEAKCRKSRYIYNEFGDTEVMEQIKNYFTLAYYDASKNINTPLNREAISKILITYPKQVDRIQFKEKIYNFEFVEVEANKDMEKPIGYEKLKNSINELLDRY